MSNNVIIYVKYLNNANTFIDLANLARIQNL